MRRLLIRPGGIGDCILSFPALEFLKADYTEVWVRGEVAPLVRFADRVCSIASTGLDLVGLPELEAPGALLERLRSFDSIVSWYGGNRVEFREAVKDLPIRFLRALPPAAERIHAADFFLREAGGEGTAVPRIEVPRAGCSGFAVIHPFSGGARKNWPIERFRELAGRLPFPVRWCAGPEEVLDNAVRMENLGDLAEWLASARVYVGNDSGITHLAASVGTPVVAIFGPSDPELWGPRGERVQVVRGGLDEINVDQVLSAVLRS